MKKYFYCNNNTFESSDMFLIVGASFWYHYMLGHIFSCVIIYV